MEENTNTNNNLLNDIWFTIKRHIVLILAIIIVCTMGGFGFSLIKKPLYTTSQQVVCTARDEEDSENIYKNFNIMSAYIGTVVDFSDEGVVIDRANFYYVQYQGELEKDPTFKVDDFINEIINTPINLDPYSTQGISQTNVGNQYIVDRNISIVSNVKDDTNSEFSFFVQYTDADEEQSKVKARILVLALRRELEAEEGTVDSKYFAGIIINISDLGSNGTTSNISKAKSTAIGLSLGIIVCIFVCIISLCDKSLKTKQDLEEVADAPVFACIDYDGGKK